MLFQEALKKIELERKHERGIREQEMQDLARIATRNRPSAVGRAWASTTAGLGRLAERGSQAVRSALTEPSDPSEQCC